MKSKTGWILIFILGIILLLVLPGLFMMGNFWGGGYGMMGGGYGYMHPFGWGGMLFGWIAGAGVLVLLVVGAVALINNLTRPASSIPSMIATRNCPNCGKPAQVDWTTCPYCGKPLS
jgi:hypothetical protein